MNMPQKISNLDEVRADMNAQKAERRSSANQLNDAVRSLRNDRPLEVALKDRDGVRAVLAANNDYINQLREEIALHQELRLLLKTETTD